MAEKKENRIAEVRKQKGFTQQSLADALGVHWVTVSKLERGVMQLTAQWMEKVAAALGVDEMELWGGVRKKTLTVDGSIIGGRTADFYSENSSVTYDTHLSTIGDFLTFWLRIEDDAMTPFFSRGDLLQFTSLVIGGGALIGRMCIFRIDGGDLQLGTLLAINDDESFDVRALNGVTFKKQKEIDAAFLSGYQPAWALSADL